MTYRIFFSLMLLILVSPLQARVRHVASGFTGTITSISPDVNMIEVQSKEDVPVGMRFILNLRTSLRWQGQSISISDLKVGDPVWIRYVSNSDVRQVNLLRRAPAKKATTVIVH